MTTKTERARLAALVGALRETIDADSPNQHLPRLRRLLDDPRVGALRDLGLTELEALEHELVQAALRAGCRDALMVTDVHRPVYNFYAGFDGNQEPWEDIPEVSLATSTPDWNLLGYRVGAPIGVPACGLTANSRWVKYLSRWGWNVLTYKTVRSQAWAGHPFPNWLFVDGELEPISAQEADAGSLTVRASQESWPKNWERASTVNSFGVPSPSPTVWQDDVASSLQVINPSNQVLLVSVMGSPESYEGDALVADYVAVVKLAIEAGAKFIEVNLSCPNSGVRAERYGELVCQDVELSSNIMKACHDAAKGQAKLLAKLAYVHKDILVDWSHRVGGLLAGISAINTLPVRVIDPATGVTPFKGTSKDVAVGGRDFAGLSGFAIRDLARQAVATLSDVREAGRFTFDIIGMGGANSVADAWMLHSAGANAVQVATGAALNPGLAAEYAGSIAARMAHQRRSTAPSQQAQKRSWRSIVSAAISGSAVDELVQ